MFTRLITARYLRRLSRDLTRIAAALDAQTAVITRLVTHLAPVDPPTERTLVSAETGVSYLDPVEADRAQAYVLRTLTDTGHVPDDEEILIYLGDEQTTDLGERLAARQAELARLAETRR